jgi:hypothetical protein
MHGDLREPILAVSYPLGGCSSAIRQMFERIAPDLPAARRAV